MIQSYFNKITELQTLVMDNEKKNMEEAAKVIAKKINKDGIVQVFGCGHSHILAEEVFFRAGSLACIKPILHEPLMLHEGAVLSAQLEKRNGYAKEFIQNEDIRADDVVIVISTSGRNPVPIDVAICAKEKGAFVIGITSKKYAKSQASLHETGKYLHDFVDLVIDNHAYVGDAVLEHPFVRTSFSPTSTVIGSFILHALFAECIVEVSKYKIDPPVFMSGNIDGSSQYNLSLVEKYKKRIPKLTEGLLYH